MFFRIVLIILGAFLVADSFFAASISNMNLGIVMPFVIGLPLIIVGIFFKPLQSWWQSNILGKIFKWGMISAYGLFTMLFITTTTLILTAAVPSEDQRADALIVLGAGIRGETPSLVLKHRLDTAIDYYYDVLGEYEDESSVDDTDSAGSNNENKLLIIVSGGMGEGEFCTEASVMKKYLIENGIPEDSIIEEGNSHSTEENFAYSYDIIRNELGTDAKIAFVTTKFHGFRAERVARAQGIYAFLIPSKDFDLLIINNYFRECAAITQHFLSGKL